MILDFMSFLSSNCCSFLFNLISFVASLDYRSRLATELKLADVVVLTYACDHPMTLDRLSTFWLPELRRLEVCVFTLFFYFLLFLEWFVLFYSCVWMGR